MLANPPTPSTLINGNRATAGTVVTIPANSIFSCDVAISGAITAAGTGRPTLTLNSAGTTFPPAGSIVADMTVAGLLGVTSSNSNSIEVVVATDATHTATLDFALGGASAASVVINGFTF